MNMTKTIPAGSLKIGGKQPLVLIAGPCAIESRTLTLELAGKLKQVSEKEQIPLVFKASYDKANRSSVKGFRGLGMDKGLEILAEVKSTYGLSILTDVHTPQEAPVVAEVADILQLPAFLCRQTDLVVALGETGKVVNIKKGQFLAPWDVRHIIAKVEQTGNRKILLTERGSSFGYNNLVADMRSLLVMRDFGYPVIFDATHSVQLPGAGENGTAGEARWAPYLARAAVATGCDAVFIETHTHPERALSDRDNLIKLSALPALIRQLKAIDQIVDTKGPFR
jgi:2-dehydro-3-deoxyphosphooctonate aldolase (KDO 8-P synthase)